ncbi:hypothetical protein KKH56_02650 [bacterium]|nr:hypothetical protein [bacterium]
MTVTINGSRLDPNAEVKLTKEGEESITAYLLTGSADGTRLMARFDLIGNKSGSWDLVISNPGNGSDTEPFDVIEGGEAKLAMSFAGPSTIREGRGAMFTVILKNEGLVDLGPVIVNMTPESVEKTRAGSYAHSGNPPYSCSKCSSQSSEQTTPPLFFSPIMIDSVPAGEETLIPISVIAIPSPSEDCWLVTAEVRYSLSEEMIRQEECEKLQKYWVELGKLIEKYQSMYTQVQTVWITTADTSAIFAGQDGHTYRFYSIARDNVGNIESAPETPDAETTVTVTAIQEGIAVSPNPFVPTRGHTQISFFGAGLPYSKIKIYNKAAELVRTLEETEGKTRLDWDATSDDGKKLASGVYIWVSTDQAGKHQKGKFAIIR